MSQDITWLTVYGFGAHIKSTQKKLIILNKGVVSEYPLEDISHLLVVGGHTIHSSTISHLVRQGAFITFFDPDGTPTGVIRPYGDNSDTLKRIQHEIPQHRYATVIAQAALKSRLLALENLQETRGASIFYDGESQFLHKSLEELEYLIKLDEIRRLTRLTSDMYYEILARDIPVELGFRRRTAPPQNDVVNAMLSFGYAMLAGNGCVSIIGARLDPDIGLLHEGQSGLVHDLMEPFKAQMIDAAVCRVAHEHVNPHDVEITPTRCMLSDDLVRKLIGIFQKTLDKEKIDRQVDTFLKSITQAHEFTMLY